MFEFIKNFQKTRDDKFKYVVIGEDGEYLFGANNYEITRDICRMLSQDDTDRFFIFHGNKLNIFSISRELNQDTPVKRSEKRTILDLLFLQGEELEDALKELNAVKVEPKKSRLKKQRKNDGN